MARGMLALNWLTFQLQQGERRCGRLQFAASAKAPPFETELHG
jgi:hypothetical protein